MTPTLRARLTGLAAAATLTALIVGVPAALLATSSTPGWPGWPRLRDLLTSPDDGTLALTALTLVAWLTWAFLTGTTLLEIGARLRGIPTPRLPGLALPQSAAHGLVGAAVLLFATAPTPAAAATTPPAAATTNQADTATAPEATAATGPAVPTAPTYTVRPGDTLWSIAADRLDDPHRWGDIADLNTDTVSDPLTTGTVLQLPSTTTQSGRTVWKRYTVQRGDTLSGIAADELGDPDRYPEIYAASRHTAQPGGRHLTDPDLIVPGWVLTLPGQATAPARVPATTRQDTTPVPPPATTGLKPADRGPAIHTAAPTTRPDAHTSTDNPAVTEQDEQTSFPWLVTGLATAPVLAGSLWLLLTRRRATQQRHRRPGRTIAPPPPPPAPIEKTPAAPGALTAPDVERLDLALRHLATQHTTAGKPMPTLAAVELTPEGATAHFQAPAELPPPWVDRGTATRWILPVTADLDPGGAAADQPAPYPLLVTIGTSDTGDTWLLNTEGATLTLTGDPTMAADLARYLAAEIACNPWSRSVTAYCHGPAADVTGLNADRLRAHDTIDEPAAEVLTHAVATHDRATAHHLASGPTGTATARAVMAGDDDWPAAVLFADTTRDAPAELGQLITLLDQHPATAGTAVVLTSATSATGVVAQLSPSGRIHLPHVGLDLVAVGLTRDEALGCASLLAVGAALQDQPMPDADGAGDQSDWRADTDAAGALRASATRPRDPHGDATSLLPDPDEDYLDHAATTADDLAALAPRLDPATHTADEDLDPTLDEDLALWFADECPLPRLTLLGPVTARTRGTALAERKAYMTAVLTFIALRPQGATPDQLADAMGITGAKAREYARVVRDWLGTNPRTGDPHLPDARKAPAALERGIGVYQVQDLLIDADLFRRLRRRGQTRGSAGIDDLVTALTLVAGEPFSQLRPGAWTWLHEGDRHDHHLTAAIVDSAHLVTTAALRHGDLDTARAAAERAVLAAPYDETPRLDLVAVEHADGRDSSADDLLHSAVLDRADVPGPPEDLPERSSTLIRRHRWTGGAQAS
ncbi:LysM peptidoglycan-binding domain-containing protein [Phycicoccus sp.]|uniref:LysM peptidoglycan-binding domain-containing protein n=1 Tax=Phycicoccus sp. TaxID=1902410 RepID=UPI002B5A7C47|nr:LysM peptidoglycan-binding domain-containing protein [Phycicoccus sp.]HMM94016.1 LysM peptidoglycan-binding domain-containing protein [Phycicoccus sp.]